MHFKMKWSPVTACIFPEGVARTSPILYSNTYYVTVRLTSRDVVAVQVWRLALLLLTSLFYCCETKIGASTTLLRFQVHVHQVHLRHHGIPEITAQVQLTSQQPARHFKNSLTQPSDSLHPTLPLWWRHFMTYHCITISTNEPPPRPGHKAVPFRLLPVGVHSVVLASGVLFKNQKLK